MAELCVVCGTKARHSSARSIMGGGIFLTFSDFFARMVRCAELYTIAWLGIQLHCSSGTWLLDEMDFFLGHSGFWFFCWLLLKFDITGCDCWKILHTHFFKLKSMLALLTTNAIDSDYLERIPGFYILNILKFCWEFSAQSPKLFDENSAYFFGYRVMLLQRFPFNPKVIILQ